MDDPEILIGDLADRIPIQSWRILRLIDRGLIPPPRRVGRYRVFRESDIPAIRAAAEAAGYIKGDCATATAR